MSKCPCFLSEGCGCSISSSLSDNISLWVKVSIRRYRESSVEMPFETRFGAGCFDHLLWAPDYKRQLVSWGTLPGKVCTQSSWSSLLAPNLNVHILTLFYTPSSDVKHVWSKCDPQVCRCWSRDPFPICHDNGVAGGWDRSCLQQCAWRGQSMGAVKRGVYWMPWALNSTSCMGSSEILQSSIQYLWLSTIRLGHEALLKISILETGSQQKVQKYVKVVDP